jgi:phosphoribosylformylglycinamidine synthase subunit PurQ / glutaminase
VSTTVGVVMFPGTNCEQDVAWAVQVLGGESEMLWHADNTVGRSDAIVIAGGFAHGDYLRTGAIARFSPVMAAVEQFARSGKPVLGICNGFQVLTEAGLLPGTLLRNAGLRFVCRDVPVAVERASAWLPGAGAGDSLTLPVKHMEGCWFTPPQTAAALAAGGQVLLRYEEDVNGSVAAVAGMTNAAGNVAGLMPHPEHAVDPLLGSTDGAVLLRGLLALAAAHRAAAGVAA